MRRFEMDLSDGYLTSAYLFPAAACEPRSRASGMASGPSSRDIAVMFHGIQSHPGWFVGSAMALAQAGVSVLSVTRRGSGTNAVDHGDAPSAEQLMDDVATACGFARELAANVKDSDTHLHLIGISWGGKLLASCLAAGRIPQPASLTLVAPGICPRVDVPVSTKIAIGLSMLCCPRRQFEIPLSDVDLFTDNPAMREYLRKDPCRLMKASARFLFASRQMDRIIAKSPRGCIKAPTTLILAQTDRIIDNAATRREVGRLTADRAEKVEFPGCHTLEFEEDPQPLFWALNCVDRSRGNERR